MAGTQSNSPFTAAPNSQSQQTAKPEATLQDVLDTMHESDIFPRTGKDVPSRFWSAYERVAKQHDDEFIERHTGELDVLLIFAGLFSAVSSAFIVNMQSSLSPNASDTTNALLKILVNKIDNTTFPAQEAVLPVWTGPSSTIIWTQTLAHVSLSSSLLAAFGAVLCKQWLGNFKTSRFGRGELHERCWRRQQKFVGLETWHFSTIIAILPVFLQLSLLFFGIALSADVWIQQHTVASVIMATTSFGFLFYFFTVVASLKSPDCPFQTPVSTMLQHIFRLMAAIRKAFRRKWEENPKSLAGFLDDLLQYSRRVVYNTKVLLTKSIGIFRKWLSRLLSTLRHRSLVKDSEVTAESEQFGGTGVILGQLASNDAGEQTPSFEVLRLDFPRPSSKEYRENEIQCSAVQWILETSTDTDVITAAARMVPEIEWPEDVFDVLYRLHSQFYACFDSTRHTLPLAEARGTACLKAICHLHIEQYLGNAFHLKSDGRVYPPYKRQSIFRMPLDHDFLVIYCATKWPLNLDITSLTSSDRMWLAHVFTYRLNNGEDGPNLIAFVIDFVRICLDSESSSRLMADCLLLAGMLVGLRIDQRCLVKLDKKSSIDTLQRLVIDRIFGLLAGDIPGSKWDEVALKLVHPLLPVIDIEYYYGIGGRNGLQRCLKCCFRLLEEDLGAMGEDHARSVAILLRCQAGFPIELSKEYTQRQVDLLVDFHLRICEGTDHKTIDGTFEVLARLDASPSTQDRMRCYIDTMIRCMEITPKALHAAWTVRSAIASLGQKDESFRERFSTALSSVLWGRDSTTHQLPDDTPSKKATDLVKSPNITYLKFLCLLSQVPIWHPQLHQSGHFENCLAIANALSSEKDNLFGRAVPVPVAHILAMMDASGEEHPFSKAVQGYPSWPVILQAWYYIFISRLLKGSFVGFEGDWHIVSTTECIAALPPLIVSARKRCGNGEEPVVIALVEQALHTMNEDRQYYEQDGSQEDEIFAPGEYDDLYKEICRLLDAM